MTTAAVADARATRWPGAWFALLFVVATIPLLGDLLGAFADGASTFGYFDRRHDRLRHAAGACVLTLSGFLFVVFTIRVSSVFDPAGSSLDGRLARLAAAGFAALLGVSASALATVSLSIEFGRVTGDPGIEQSQELLPQLGYVVLFVPAALSAGLVVLVVTRALSRGRHLPTWMVGVGYATAAAQLVSIFTVPMLLIPLWVLGIGATVRERG